MCVLENYTYGMQKEQKATFFESLDLFTFSIARIDIKKHK